MYVGDSIVRKTDTIFSKGEDVVVCLPGYSSIPGRQIGTRRLCVISNTCAG